MMMHHGPFIWYRAMVISIADDKDEGDGDHKGIGDETR